MINLRLAMDFGWSVGVVIGYIEFEFVGGIFPKARVGCYGYVKDG
jgi:hypothetical protein